jgi:hypothetical protein
MSFFFFYKIGEEEGRTGTACAWYEEVDTSGRGRRLGKGVGG